MKFKSFQDYMGDRVAADLAHGIFTESISVDQIVAVFEKVKLKRENVERGELYNELMAGLAGLGSDMWKGTKGALKAGWDYGKDAAIWAGQKASNSYMRGEQISQINKAIVSIQQLQKSLLALNFNNANVSSVLEKLTMHLKKGINNLQKDPSKRLANGGVFPKMKPPKANGLPPAASQQGIPTTPANP